MQVKSNVSEKKETNYAAEFKEWLEKNKVSPGHLKARVQKYAKDNYSKAEATIVASNLLKQSRHSTMTKKVFNKLVKAASPTA